MILEQKNGKCGYMNSTVIAFVLITSIFGILLTPSSTYAIIYAATMNKATSGGSLNVMVQPTPTPIVKGTQTNFTVSFEQKGICSPTTHRLRCHNY